MSLKTTIVLSFVFVGVYAVSILVNWITLAIGLVCASPVVLIWLAYRSLKDPYTPPYSFKEKFYEDHDYFRIQ